MRRGFTLVELSLVLVVVGLMVAFGLPFFSGNNTAECNARTQQQLATIEAALQNFAATHARMPKPARMDLGSSAAQFGYEAMGSITDPANAGFATDVPASGVVHTGGVLIGAVPHIALGLANENASDCWGDKFTYAVTNALTSSHPTAGYPGTNVGAITMRSGTLASPQPLSSTISFVVISHGEDKYGATPMSASNTTPRNCNGSTEPKIDRENCNSDTIFFNSTPNTGDAGNYFDDLLVFGAKLQSTEPCGVQAQTWMTDCNGSSSPLIHGATGVVSNSVPGYTGDVTVTCNDSVLIQSAPSCTVSNDCASQGLNEGEGNYDAGSCTLTSCCSGTIVTSNPSPCPAASYMAGSGNCLAPTCDSDPSDGLSPGFKYCAGVIISSGSGNYVCSGGVWGASYPFSCNGTQCLSGSASSSILSDTSGCGSPDCSGGDTPPVANCNETATCTCN